MKIGLCDDDIEVRIMVRDWLTAYHPEIAPQEIHEFMCGEALLEYLRLHSLDIVFLDCRMDGMDGIDTAKAIRKSNDKLTIIILTDHSGYAVHGYGIGAFDFIIKENFHKKVGDIFENAVKRFKRRESVIIPIKTVQGLIQTDVSNILYVESELRKKKIILEDGISYETYDTMEHLEEILKPHGFICPHKGYLVNSRYMREFTPVQIKLMNGIVLPVSRRRYKAAADAFTSNFV